MRGFTSLLSLLRAVYTLFQSGSVLAMFPLWDCDMERRTDRLGLR